MRKLEVGLRWFFQKLKLEKWHMKYSVLILGIFLYFSGTIFAQQNDVTFQANDLQRVSQRYTGASLNWPLVVGLASHNSQNNSFTLRSSDLQRLQNFSLLSVEVAKQEERIHDLIGSGATIFAPEKLTKTNQAVKEYKAAVQNGNLQDAITYAEQIPALVDVLENTLLSNRLVDVQAQIAKKEGDVDKRKGLLGSWEDAFQGDLMKQLDGLRTMVESYANLSFTDGSTVIIEPNTEAVIRKARIDKLDESSDTEITLENGSLLAKLSASAKGKSKYILNAGPSSSELKSQNFYAEADGPQVAKLTNYDGEAIVNANNITITIKKNEGTIVEEGKDPLPPVKLLPAPELTWATRDTIIYKSEILYPFIGVKSAQNYRVQYSTSPNFDGEVNTINTTQTSVTLEELPLGTIYVRVQASDNLGLKGPFSETVRIIRNIDNKPPPLFIDNTSNDLLFTLDNTIDVSGVTEPNARLKIDDEWVRITGSGQFSVQRTELKYDQTLTLSSVDNSGNETTKTLRIIKLTENVLFDLNIQGASGENPIKASQKEITISGNAYPALEVQIGLMDIQKSIKTDSRGRWGATIPAKSGNLTIIFKNAYSGQIYISKLLTIESDS
jgi:hypothetical protein